MLYHARLCGRPGATLVECAFVYPTTFLLTLGLIVVALGVFRYQEVALLAREGARWASVHAGQYSQETGNPVATALLVYDNAIEPKMVSLNANNMQLNGSSCPPPASAALTWGDGSSGSHMPTYTQNGQTVVNTVTVTVSYQWIPEVYLGGVTLSSSAVAPVSY